MRLAKRACLACVAWLAGWPSLACLAWLAWLAWLAAQIVFVHQLTAGDWQLAAASQQLAPGT